MINNQLAQAQQVVDHLTPSDQMRLLAYLATRLARLAAFISSTPASTPKHTTTWQEFFRQGDALAAGDAPGTPTLTNTILTMRR